MTMSLEEFLRRRRWARRLSRWTALLFFILGTFLYTLDSDLVTFLLPVRSVSVISLLIAGILFLFQFFEARRQEGSVPVVVLTGLVLSFLLAGLVYTQEYRAYREVEISFDNGGITLEGTLYLPSSEGRHPAVVIAPGPVRSARRLYHIWSDMFVRRGYAVLNFDKRGTGSSGGTYETEHATSDSNLSILASDIAAGLRRIRMHPEIDPNATGLLVMSLSAWLAPKVAAEVPDIAFMAFLSGPAVSVGEEELFTRLSGDGTTVLSQDSLDMINVRMMQEQPSGYDPRPLLREMNVPSLWLYGDGDRSIPVAKSTAVIDSLVRANGLPYRYIIYPGANHLLVRSEWPYRFPETLRNELLGFVEKSVSVAE